MGSSVVRVKLSKWFSRISATLGKVHYLECVTNDAAVRLLVVASDDDRVVGVVVEVVLNVEAVEEDVGLAVD